MATTTQTRGGKVATPQETLKATGWTLHVKEVEANKFDVWATKGNLKTIILEGRTDTLTRMRSEICKDAQRLDSMDEEE
jgi:hypothetical protein